MRFEERVTARGHENVSARHESTFELTTDDFLTPAGDCILGIEADRAPADFASSFVEACQDASATIEARISVDGGHIRITGRGDPDLSFESERSLVGRTSTYVDDRTIMVEADAAAADIDPAVVEALQAGGEIDLRLRVQRG